MKKNLLLAAFSAFSSLSIAQVGIYTPNPQASFHIDAGKDNPKTGTPSASQQVNDFSVVLQSGIGAGSMSVGIGTIAPTQRLDITNGNVRIRDINSIVGTGSDKLLVASSAGVLKVAGGDFFSVGDSGNRVLDATLGGIINAANNWDNNSFTTLVMDEQYDPLNAYNPTSGEFIVPQDGLYYIYGVCGFNTPKDGSGIFDGTSGTAFASIVVDGGRVATTNTHIYRGAKNPGTLNDANLFFLASNATVWLKGGQKVVLQYMTYGTENMVDSLSDLQIDKAYSRLQINKLL